MDLKFSSHTSRKIIGGIEVLRPLNTVFLIMIVFFTLHVIGPSLVLGWNALTFAALSLGFISTGAYAMNDYFDAEVDGFNNPNRPIPRGDVSRKGVKWVVFCCYAGGILLSLLTFDAILPFLLLCLYAFTLFLYNWKLQKTIFKNFLIGLACGFSVLIGAAAVENINLSSIIFFAFIFAATFAREIIKDVNDYEDDKKMNFRTFPSVLGLKKSVLLFRGTLAGVVLFSPAFFFLTPMNFKYLLVILLANLIFAYSIVCSMNLSACPPKKASALSKAGMFLAFIALIVGRI